MAAVRFSTTYLSRRGISRTIEIWDSDYSGDSTDFETAAGGYGLSYENDGGEWPGQFKATECEFTFVIQNGTHEALITDLATSPEGRFMVRIFEDSALWWTGNVLADNTTYDEAYYPYSLTIRATDGIGTLKDIDFSDAGTAYTGKERIIEYVTKCLSKISYVPTFYGGSDVFVRTSIDWWEETMTNSSVGADAWNFAYLDQSVYHKFEKGVQKFTSCYDVLKDILTAFESTLTYAAGAFWIEQVSYREASTIIQRNYQSDGTFIDAANYTDTNIILQNTAGALLAVGKYDFTTGILEARHEFQANERRNFMLAKQNFDETDSVKTYATPIHGNSNSTTLRLTGSLVVRIASDSPAPGYTNPFMPFVAVFRINLALDTKGLARAYVLTAAYQVQYAPIEWSLTPGFYVIVPFSGPFMANVTSNTFTFSQTLDVVTPFLPENCDDFSFSFQLEALKRYDGGTYNLADFTTTYDLSGIWLEAYSYGTPVLSDDSHEYVTASGEPTNTVVHKSESLIGSSFNPNTLGAIWVKPSSTYILAADWGEGVTTPSFNYIGQLLTTVMAQMRATPTRRITGQLIGDIVALSRVIWDGSSWILIGGKWNSDDDIFDGTWLEVKHTTGLTPSPPIKTFGHFAGHNPNWIGLNTGTATTGGNTFNAAAIPPGTLLNPVAQTVTNSDIRAGSISAIAIADTLSDYDFNSGDYIAIVDPFTGAFERLTINATTTAGQTSLSVATQTLALDYPIGSPIVKIPRIGGGASLPGGVNGQILRRTGGKWAGYGTTALADGVILTWTDAGGWAAAAPATSGTVTSVAASAPPAGITISGSPITGSGTFVFALANDLAALEALASTGIAVRSATDTWVQRAIAAGTGISVSNGDGVSGNPTISITGTSYNDEAIQDLIGAMLTDSATIDFTYDDIGATITAIIIANSVGNSQIRQGAPRSVMGVTGNATANIADIQGTSDQVLRVTTLGTSLGFGQVATGGIADSAVTLIKIQQISTAVFLGRNTAATGVVEQLSIATAKTMLGLTGTNSGDQTITLTGDVTGSGTGSFAATIANNAVTLAKMAQVATARFLGRTTAGTGNVEAMTATQATALLDAFTSALKGLVPASGGGTSNYLRADGTWAAPAGTGVTQSTTLVSGRITHSSGSNQVTDTANHLWDNTNGRETIIPQVAGLGGGAAALNINPPGAGTLASMEGLRIWGNINGNLMSVISNTNTGASSAAISLIETQGDTGGDPILQFHIAGTGGVYTAVGLDNSDSNKFKITPNAASPGFLTNVGLTMTQTATTLVGINKDSPSYELHVGGRTMSDAFYNTTNTWSSGFISFGVGAGTGPSISSISGGANWMAITFSTGTSPTANGNIFTATYPQAFPAFPSYVVFSASNANAATDHAKFYMSGGTAGGFNMQANGTLTASTQYKLDFHFGGTG